MGVGIWGWGHSLHPLTTCFRSGGPLVRRAGYFTESYGLPPLRLSNGNKNHALPCHLDETDKAPNAVHRFSADVGWALQLGVHILSSGTSNIV